MVNLIAFIFIHVIFIGYICNIDNIFVLCLENRWLVTSMVYLIYIYNIDGILDLYL